MFVGPDAVGIINIPELPEASSLTASRGNDGVLWTMDDGSGGGTEMFAIDTQGRLLGVHRLPGAVNVDIEDMAIGRGPAAGVDYLYLADTGNNRLTRTSFTLYRVPEPAVYTHWADDPIMRDVPGVAAITFSYPDGIYNAEVLLADPITGDVVVGTKRFGSARFYRFAAADLIDGAVVVPQFMLEIPLPHEATGGNVSPDGRQILIRTLDHALLFNRMDGQSLTDALAGVPISVPIQTRQFEPLGEGITFDRHGVNYYSNSERAGTPLSLYERVSDDAPAVARSLIAAGSSWRYLDGAQSPAQAGHWASPAFDDESWSEAQGPFGYGQGDERTVIEFGLDADDKSITTYFRAGFDVDDPRAVADLTMKLLFDDGAAVYLNGVRVAHLNLPPVTDAATPALAERDLLGNTWVDVPLDATRLIAGLNTIAVELHQASAAGEDVSFDLQLLALLGPPTDPSRIGDADVDGDVDLDDLMRLAAYLGSRYGASWGEGDFTFDGRVTITDLRLLAAQYDVAPLDAAGAVPVPVPGSGTAVVIGLALRTVSRDAKRSASRRTRSAPRRGSFAHINPDSSSAGTRRWS